jgi:hypothetical protein
MNLPIDVAEWLQFTLRDLAIDYTTCGGVISGNIKEFPDHTNARWQFGVDMIYRLNTSGLTYIRYFLNPPREMDEFYRILQTSNPFLGGSGFVWYGSFMSGTDSLRALVEKYFPSSRPYNPSLNGEFVQEIEDLFQSNKVAWSTQPLLPIVQ